PEEAQRLVHLHAPPETSRVTADVHEGWTKRFTSTGQWNAVKERSFLATFSYTSYLATGGEPSSYACARVLKAHGSCWVSNKDAKWCDIDQDGLGQPVQVPVKRYEYSAPHRFLTAQVSYPSCAVADGSVKCDVSTGIRSEFLAYDARGHLVRSRDANGVETRLEYAEGRLESEMTIAPGLAPLEKRYAYDG